MKSMSNSKWGPFYFVQEDVQADTLVAPFHMPATGIYAPKVSIYYKGTLLPEGTKVTVQHGVMPGGYTVTATTPDGTGYTAEVPPGEVHWGKPLMPVEWENPKTTVTYDIVDAPIVVAPKEQPTYAKKTLTWADKPAAGIVKDITNFTDALVASPQWVPPITGIFLPPSISESILSTWTKPSPIEKFAQWDTAQTLKALQENISKSLKAMSATAAKVYPWVPETTPTPHAAIDTANSVITECTCSAGGDHEVGQEDFDGDVTPQEEANLLDEEVPGVIYDEYQFDPETMA
jgi:hypothetical protein